MKLNTKEVLKEVLIFEREITTMNFVRSVKKVKKMT